MAHAPPLWRRRLLRCALLLMATMIGRAAHGGDPGSAFTYQGELRQSGNLVNGEVDMEFRLFNNSVGGVQVGSTHTILEVDVVNGRFTVPLDFGSNVFDGAPRWLQIAVDGVTLTPRQQIRPTPYAMQTRGLFVDSNQNVGINTTAPQARLDVVGTIRSTRYELASGYHLDADVQSALIPGWFPSGNTFPGLFLETFGAIDASGGMYVGDDVVSIWNEGPDMLRLYNSNDLPSGNPRFVVNDLGWIGVGHSDPLWPVHARAVQAVARLETLLSTNGSVLELRNNAASPNFIGGINFVNSAGATPGQIGYTGDNQMTFRTAGFERMRIDDAGVVSIGGVSGFPGALVINSSSVSMGVPPATLHREGDGLLIFFARSGVTQGSISVTGNTVSYNAFTGSHFAWIAAAESIEPFALMRMTGDNRRLHDSAESEIVYGAERCAVANDPACLGAYLGRSGVSGQGIDRNPHLVMAVGNGEMWIVDSGRGDIQPGDWLISSDVPGCAMKDDADRFAVGHIVARAAERVDWSAIVADAAGVKRTTISVLFESFVRTGGGDEGRLRKSLEEQSREIECLRVQVRSLESLAQRLERLESLQPQH